MDKSKVTHIPLVMIGRSVEIAPREDNATNLLRLIHQNGHCEYAVSRGDAVRIVAALCGHFNILPNEVAETIHQLNNDTTATNHIARGRDA